MQTFEELSKKSKAVNERNDCAVIALSVVTGVDYNEVRLLLTKLGRRWGKATNWSITKEGLAKLGFDAVNIRNDKFKHPLLQHKTVRTLGRSITLYNGKVFLVRTPKHILGVRNGQIIDWTQGRCNRINSIMEVRQKV